jgi:hypothetical protein
MRRIGVALERCWAHSPQRRDVLGQIWYQRCRRRLYRLKAGVRVWPELIIHALPVERLQRRQVVQSQLTIIEIIAAG